VLLHISQVSINRSRPDLRDSLPPRTL
jgi:hypothetical protein